ncbi:hypothetical protein OG444_37435 [Streptomyces sp. NBC_01232]|uniref:hypothetical protein n=1 Tax=Streptomyces sp. NBC_01232 TaxID=2903786 RepID=UPI002E0DBB41|nr:hypothetical protein OG444_37435 [Streptomyces sp. NBC_01232]
MIDNRVGPLLAPPGRGKNTMRHRTAVVRAACLAATVLTTAALSACGSSEPAAPREDRAAPSPSGVRRP